MSQHACTVAEGSLKLQATNEDQPAPEDTLTLSSTDARDMQESTASDVTVMSYFLKAYIYSIKSSFGHHCRHFNTPQILGTWSSGMILPSGGSGPEFDSRCSPFCWINQVGILLNTCASCATSTVLVALTRHGVMQHRYDIACLYRHACKGKPCITFRCV